MDTMKQKKKDSVISSKGGAQALLSRALQTLQLNISEI